MLIQSNVLIDTEANKLRICDMLMNLCYTVILQCFSENSGF